MGSPRRSHSSRVRRPPRRARPSCHRGGIGDRYRAREVSRQAERSHFTSRVEREPRPCHSPDGAFFVAAAARGRVCQRRDGLFDKRDPRNGDRRAVVEVGRGAAITRLPAPVPSLRPRQVTSRSAVRVRVLSTPSPAEAGRRLRVIVTLKGGGRHPRTRPGRFSVHVRGRFLAPDPTPGDAGRSRYGYR